MSGTLVRAGELVAQLAGAGLNATTDPSAVTGLEGPCVLIGPPRLGPTATFAGLTVTWRLVCLPASRSPLEAWRELDELVAAVCELLPVELGEPSSYVLHASADPIPCYFLTLTDS